MIPIFSLLVLAVLLGAVAGWRASKPIPAILELMLSPEKRPLVAVLFMLKGPSNFVDPAANATLLFSFRYGETPFTLRTLGWAIGLSSAFVVAAIYLGWLFFNITTIGGWNFFVGDVGLPSRVFRTAAAVIPLALIIALAADAKRFGRHPFIGSEKAVGGAVAFVWIVAVLIQQSVWQNNGLFFLSAGVVLLTPANRLMFLAMLLVAYLALVFDFAGSLGPTHAVIATFILVVAAMLLLAFLGAVEVLAALRWSDAGTFAIVLGIIAVFALGLVSALAIPFLMTFILYAVMELSPESFHAGWVNTVGVFREGGRFAAMMLAIACTPPLLPALWFGGRGLGETIARNSPAMTRLIHDLRAQKDMVTPEDFENILENHKQAFRMGYGIAGVLIALLSAVLLYLMSAFFAV